MELDPNRSDDYKFYDLERAITKLEEKVDQQQTLIDQQQTLIDNVDRQA